MNDGISYDFAEMYQLGADIEAASRLEVRRSMQQTAIETKKFWQNDARRTFPKVIAGRYAPTIDYTDLRTLAADDNTYRVDIGPNLDRFGGKTGKGGLLPSLGILEDATGGVRGRPRGSIDRALAFAQAEFVERMQLAVDQTMRTRGL